MIETTTRFLYIQKRINSLNFKPFLNTVYLLSKTEEKFSHDKSRQL